MSFPLHRHPSGYLEQGEAHRRRATATAEAYLGNTVVVIEHNIDVMKCADWIIDLGPEGGERGGQLIAAGTPEEIVRNQKSYTAQALKKFLARGRAA